MIFPLKKKVEKNTDKHLMITTILEILNFRGHEKGSIISDRA